MYIRERGKKGVGLTKRYKKIHNFNISLLKFILPFRKIKCDNIIFLKGLREREIFPCVTNVQVWRTIKNRLSYQRGDVMSFPTFRNSSKNS